MGSEMCIRDRVTKEYPIPVINGIAFLTGVGQDAEFKKLVDAVNA